ncbi:hypothetical protein M0654_03095 [Rhizobium sp. NTR19]|uniref:Uncharacterized protein n=1 Tax=Neorhizobium turbinariae TaxID=2937795 RepID=A0ABT0IM82_9HYPH|nr:hypothetical protein [Neorhizobium turbinariae]MCK8778963.1 hypothetical protein [Neorhizobium turbinariae]
MKGLKFRLSKKLIFVLMGSIVVLGGGSGAAAVFVGTDKILGPSYLELNGLSCTTIETVKIKRNKRYWVRKFVVADGQGDGMARLKTALRVAKAVQEKEKADLVQVAMLDKSGPTTRAQMRGRMIGAQVIYIPDTSKAPDGVTAQTYSAYYVDGTAAPSGEFYGMRIDLPLEDVEGMTARLTDTADCVDPPSAIPADGHGAASGHGDKPKGDAHGEAKDHGKTEGYGEASGHDAAPTAEGHDAPAEGHGEEVAAKQSGGFLSSITGMFFGGRQEAPAEDHAVEGAEHSAPEDEPAQAAHAPEPAPEPRTSAEGGKRWSKQTAADALHSDTLKPEVEHAEAAPKPVDGSTEADAAGAAWLAKLRGEAAAEHPAEPAPTH